VSILEQSLFNLSDTFKFLFILFLEASMAMSSDYHDSADPLTIPQPPLPPAQMDEEEHSRVHYAHGRSSYFADNVNMGYYSRYP
jgi:hypothetical protein